LLLLLLLLHLKLFESVMVCCAVSHPAALLSQSQGNGAANAPGATSHKAHRACHKQQQQQPKDVASLGMQMHD
jgi:hypothetical protein